MARLLLMDTAADRLGVALASAGQVLASACQPDAREQARYLLATVDEVLQAAGVARHDLDGVAFNAGPGSFTGLRIGCAAAQAMGFALDVPVVAVSSLAIVAQAAGERCPPAPGVTLLAVLDARMGECYWQLFGWDGQAAQPTGAPQVTSPADCLAGLPPEIVACGPGIACVEWPSDRMVCPPPADGVWLAPAAMARLAETAWQAGLAVPAEQAQPLYVRDRVALTTAERLAQRPA